jgi:hypothetical protein
MQVHEKNNDSKWKVGFIINCYSIYIQGDNIKQCVAWRTPLEFCVLQRVHIHTYIPSNKY